MDLTEKIKENDHPKPLEGPGKNYRVWCIACGMGMRLQKLYLNSDPTDTHYLCEDCGGNKTYHKPNRNFPRGDSGYRHNTSPWQENNVRTLEGD